VFNFVNYVTGLLKIKGATDGTKIGNIGDRLKVDISSSLLSSKLRYVDLNASSGGVSRGTTISPSAWVNLFEYNGSGFVTGLLLNVETVGTGWVFSIVIDGETLFEISGEDLTGDASYDLDDVTDMNQAILGLSKGSHDRILWHPPLNMPIRYNTSIVVKVKRTSGSKKFQAGLCILSKDT
jgi:hypothetical protein